MFVALPVRQQKQGQTHLTEAWENVEGVLRFHVNPADSDGNYIDELRIAKRRGTTRVVKAILKERSWAS